MYSRRVLEGDLHDRDAFGLFVECKRITSGWTDLAGAVEVFDVNSRMPSLVEKGFAFARCGRRLNGDSRTPAIEEGELLQALHQRGVDVFRLTGKICGSGLKVVFVPRLVVEPTLTDLAGGDATLVFLMVDVAVAVDLDVGTTR